MAVKSSQGKPCYPQAKNGGFRSTGKKRISALEATQKGVKIIDTSGKHTHSEIHDTPSLGWKTRNNVLFKPNSTVRVSSDSPAPRTRSHCCPWYFLRIFVLRFSNYQAKNSVLDPRLHQIERLLFHVHLLFLYLAANHMWHWFYFFEGTSRPPPILHFYTHNARTKNRTKQKTEPTSFEQS